MRCRELGGCGVARSNNERHQCEYVIGENRKSNPNKVSLLPNFNRFESLFLSTASDCGLNMEKSASFWLTSHIPVTL